MAGFTNDVLKAKRGDLTQTSSGNWFQFEDGTDTFGLYNNAGSPEGIVAADTGSFCCDTTNGSVYVKTTDTVNTGWELLATTITPPSYSITSLTDADSTYTVLSTDVYMSCDVSGGVLVIDLPDAPATGRLFYVKDLTGDSATNNITVTTVGGVVTIDGATSFVMNTDFESISLIFNGTSYEVF